MTRHMEQQIDSSGRLLPGPLRKWGAWAVLAGALSLALVFVQIAGPAFEPQVSAGQQIGEIAGEIRRSAWRSFLGLPPPAPEVQPVPAWAMLGLAAPILGIAAIVLSLVSGLRREGRRFVIYGAGLGASAIVFQFFWYVALLVAGVLLLIAIIENMGDIFSF